MYDESEDTVLRVSQRLCASMLQYGASFSYRLGDVPSYENLGEAVFDAVCHFGVGSQGETAGYFQDIEAQQRHYQP